MIPGPFKTDGATVKAIDHGQWFKVCRVDNLKFSREGQVSTAQQIAHALNQQDAARAMLAALKRLNAEIGEGWSTPRERAIDLIPPRTVEAMRAAIRQAEAAGIE